MASYQHKFVILLHLANHYYFILILNVQTE